MRRQPEHNHAAMFAAYANGTPLEEISKTFGMNYNTLKTIASRWKWHQLVKRLPIVQEQVKEGDEISMGMQKRAAQKLDQIEANRAANMEVAVRLRDDLIRVIEKLEGEELTLERLFHNKGMVVRADVKPGLQDRVALVTYAKMISEMTYKALGDVEKTGGSDAPAGANNQAPGLTIVLPGAIAAPRQERNVTPPDPEPAASRAPQIVDAEVVKPETEANER